MMQENKYDSSVELYSRKVETPTKYKIQSKIIIPSIVSEISTKEMNNMRKIIKNDLGGWNHKLMFEIIEKHKSSGVVLSKYQIIITVENEQMFKDTYFDIESLTFQEKITVVEYWRNIMQDRKYKIMFIPIMLKTEMSDHFNWIIIDKVRTNVELYEPYGLIIINNNINYLDFLKNIIQCSNKFRGSNCFVPRKYEFISQKKSNLLLGFQTLEGFGFQDENIDLEGYCYLWSLFFMDLRLTNLYFDVKQIQKDFIEVFSGYDIDNEETLKDIFIKEEIRNDIGKLFKEFIRKYSLYHMDRYTKDFGAELDEITKYLIEKIEILRNSEIVFHFSTEEQFIYLDFEILYSDLNDPNINYEELVKILPIEFTKKRLDELKLNKITLDKFIRDITFKYSNLKKSMKISKNFKY